MVLVIEIIFLTIRPESRGRVHRAKGGRYSGVLFPFSCRPAGEGGGWGGVERDVRICSTCRMLMLVGLCLIVEKRVAEILGRG